MNVDQSTTKKIIAGDYLLHHGTRTSYLLATTSQSDQVRLATIATNKKMDSIPSTPLEWNHIVDQMPHFEDLNSVPEEQIEGQRFAADYLLRLRILWQRRSALDLIENPSSIGINDKIWSLSGSLRENEANVEAFFEFIGPAIMSQLTSTGTGVDSVISGSAEESQPNAAETTSSADPDQEEETDQLREEVRRRLAVMTSEDAVRLLLYEFGKMARLCCGKHVKKAEWTSEPRMFHFIRGLMEYQVWNHGHLKTANRDQPIGACLNTGCSRRENPGIIWGESAQIAAWVQQQGPSSMRLGERAWYLLPPQDPI